MKLVPGNERKLGAGWSENVRGIQGDLAEQPQSLLQISMIHPLPNLERRKQKGKWPESQGE